MERAERKLPGVCVCGGVWAGGGSRGHLDPGLSRVTRGDSYFKVYSAELMNSYELELRDKGQQAMRVDEGSSAPPPPTPPPGPPILVLVGWCWPCPLLTAVFPAHPTEVVLAGGC
jgi:hypothetical protein